MTSNAVDRAKIALSVDTDTALSKALGVAQSVITGYRRRNNTVPLEQCIKIAERTGVSLDWLILGKGEAHPSAPPAAAAEPAPSPDTQMLLAGWQGLSIEGKLRILKAMIAELSAPK